MQKSVFIVVLGLALGSLAANAQAQGFMPWTKVIEMADTDGDGMLSANEVMFFDSAEHFVGFQPFMATHFKDFDANGDGFVTMEESRAAVERLGMSEADMSAAFFRQQGFMPRNAQ